MAYSGRGHAYQEKAEQDKAIADYTEAIRLNSKLARAYYHRGEVYQAKGEKAKAEDDFATAKQLGYRKAGKMERTMRKLIICLISGLTALLASPAVWQESSSQTLSPCHLTSHRARL